MSDAHMEKAQENKDEKEILSLNMRMLDNVVSATFRQIGFYDFEMKLHKEYEKKWFLPAERIDELFEQSVQPTLWKAFQNSLPYKKDWVTNRHIRQWFVTARYTPWFLLGYHIFTAVKKNPQYYQVFKNNFLKAWSSKPPKEIFANMWIDITSKQFWKDCYENMRELYEDVKSDAERLGMV